nr:Ferric hydroxamate uptake [Klebsiella pneumoniae]
MWMFPPATTASFPSRSAIPGDLKPPFRRPYQRPRLAVVRPDNGLSPYLSYSQAITPAMLPGADGKPLKPTTAEQVEAGLKFQPPGSSDLYSIAIYDLTQKDVATRDPNIATATYIPAGKVHSQGVELEAHHQITPQLSTIASYTGIVCVSGTPKTGPTITRRS